MKVAEKGDAKCKMMKNNRRPEIRSDGESVLEVKRDRKHTLTHKSTQRLGHTRRKKNGTENETESEATMLSARTTISIVWNGNKQLKQQQKERQRAREWDAGERKMKAF